MEQIEINTESIKEYANKLSSEELHEICNRLNQLLVKLNYVIDKYKNV